MPKPKMRIKTRLTDFFQIDHPIVLAPMGGVSGGILATAVTKAGGLGLIGGGYGDLDYIRAQFKEAGHGVGCGIISWSCNERPGFIDEILLLKPRAIFISFGLDKALLGPIKKAGIPLIVQVQSIEGVREAIRSGADIIVAQGTEAGGHGCSARSTLPLVCETVRVVRSIAPTTLVLAAGGISDGCSMAAMLMLGADGVLMGTRFWATHEALVSREAHANALTVDGDSTIRSKVFDVIEAYNWPDFYNGRYVKNEFLNKWHGKHLSTSNVHAARKEYLDAAPDDFRTAYLAVGECIGTIRSITNTKDLVKKIIDEAITTIRQAQTKIETS